MSGEPLDKSRVVATAVRSCLEAIDTGKEPVVSIMSNQTPAVFEGVRAELQAREQNAVNALQRLSTILGDIDRAERRVRLAALREAVPSLKPLIPHAADNCIEGSTVNAEYRSDLGGPRCLRCFLQQLVVQGEHAMDDMDVQLKIYVRKEGT